MPATLPPTPCIVQAAQRYGVPAGLIRGVLHTEGGGRGVVHANRNGSADLGWMQINTLWLPVLSRWGITRQSLLDDNCLNIAVGAWILRRYYLRFRDWTPAIRAYNVGPGLNGGIDYARRVIVSWRDFHFHQQENTQ